MVIINDHKYTYKIYLKIRGTDIRDSVQTG